MNNDVKLNIKQAAAEKVGMDKTLKEKRKEAQVQRRKKFEEREEAKRMEMSARREFLKNERDSKRAKQKAAIEADKKLQKALENYERVDIKALKHAEEQLSKIKGRAASLWKRVEETQAAQIEAELKLKNLMGITEEVLPALRLAWQTAEEAWLKTDKAFRKKPENRDRRLKKMVKEILK